MSLSAERPAPTATVDRVAGDVFHVGYSPRRIRFLLAHWEELSTLAESPKTSAHLAVHLAREWELLQERRGLDCLCGPDDTPGCAHEPSGGGDFRQGAMVAVHLIADLTRAADALPAHWQATRLVYRAQGREGQWRFRHDVWRRGARGRAQDRRPEPRGSGPVVVELMARLLGGRPDRGPQGLAT